LNLQLGVSESETKILSIKFDKPIFSRSSRNLEIEDCVADLELSDVIGVKVSNQARLSFLESAQKYYIVSSGALEGRLEMARETYESGIMSDDPDTEKIVDEDDLDARARAIALQHVLDFDFSTRHEYSRDSHIDSLDWAGKKITDDDLAHLRWLKGLDSLKLSQTELDDVNLVQLRGLRQLQHLELRSTGITNSGMEHLAKLTGLRDLDLSSTEVGDFGLLYLRRLKNLRLLNLRDTNVTSDGQAELKTHLPNVDVKL
jgi:hypothetical protein